MNKQNLLRMADYIETVSQEKFDMTFWREDSEMEFKTECNTVGCVIGHCVVLSDESFEIPRILNRDGRIDFFRWSELFTGLDTTTAHDNEVWDYLFRSSWRKIDNTPSGAAARIRHVVKYGLPPTYFEEMQGNHPLSYKTN